MSFFSRYGPFVLGANVIGLVIHLAAVIALVRCAGQVRRRRPGAGDSLHTAAKVLATVTVLQPLVSMVILPFTLGSEVWTLLYPVVHFVLRCAEAGGLVLLGRAIVRLVEVPPAADDTTKDPFAE